MSNILLTLLLTMISLIKAALFNLFLLISLTISETFSTLGFEYFNDNILVIKSLYSS